ncbi:MAG: LacI family transcriptional regulator [Saprospiraceae bacterium]|nr:LacI family transcriptional regulator [Saprospiraceae bacterium]
MSKHRVTLKDIAAQLGVTPTTVSKALKDYPDIGKETKQKVKELAKALNYQPDSHALALKNKKTNTVGVIIPEIAHFFFAKVIKGMMSHLEENGYRLLITLSGENTEQEIKQVNLLFNNKVDGLLVSLANETQNTDHFKQFTDYSIPLVMFDKVDEWFPCKKVLIHDKKGAFTATNHLIERGCKRIAHIRGPKYPLNAIQRHEGYMNALATANMDYNPDLVKQCEAVTFEEGYAFTKELLTMDQPPDGIFAVTDQVAVGALQAAKDLNVEVPEALKIVGFSDSQVGQIVKPALTTIHQPGYEIGATAAQLLIEEIELKSKGAEHITESTQIILDTYLIQREST